MFRKLIFTFSILFLLNSCATQQKITSKSDWYAFIKTSSEKMESSKVYEFTDDMIRMHGKDIGYLMTKKSYKNFELSLDFRWNLDGNFNKGNAKKNSGVMYNIPTNSPDHIWPKGIQFQIKDGFTGDFIFLDNVTAVVKGKLIEAGASVNSDKFSDNEKPYGEWNSVLIKSYNGKITQFLNGKLVNECIQATATEGTISLNYEGSPIDFRNIQIKNISKE